ncbi:hypothetical protein H8356DRAFT_1662464 [Neocallimastix lanati (nom. inval.)]|nr:hypothetical protein H8356DRAFT_1662464 [Neocallimastix sp. JGI-2020a]
MEEENIIVEDKDINKMMDEERSDVKDNETSDDFNILKRKLYHEIKNRWNIEEKLKSQYNLFVTFQKMLDCSIKQITENQNIIEELYTRLREANTKIKELEEENVKLRNKCQALEKKWYKQNIFNDGFNGNVLANMDRRKRYSLPLPNLNANALDPSLSDRNSPLLQSMKDNATTTSSTTLNMPELSKDNTMLNNNSTLNSPFSEIEDGEDKVVLYKTNDYSVDMDSDNDIESDESSNSKNLPTSFILNNEMFEKISHIKNEENNYEKQIEDLIQKTVQYKLEIFENNYSYKN